MQTASPDTSYHVVQRRLSTLLEDTSPPPAAAPLELIPRAAQEPPSVRPAEVIESGGMHAHAILPPHISQFAAFLDGAQLTLVLKWLDGIPVIHGSVSAVIRQRKNRRLTTWRSPIVQRSIYAPLELLSVRARTVLEDTDLPVVNTLENRNAESVHPFELQELAYRAVLTARESVEQELAALWCEAGDEPLCVDGSISGSRVTAEAPHIIGVVKSHQMLYGDATDLATVMALRAGERSSVMRVTNRRRPSVASWYLRLRERLGSDPFWGLVRVEIAEKGKAPIADRADDVSRWVLGEALPLAVPDGRWDKMVYGIRDCEEYLRAVQ